MVREGFLEVTSKLSQAGLARPWHGISRQEKRLQSTRGLMCVPFILHLRGWGWGEGRNPQPSTGMEQVQSR